MSRKIGYKKLIPGCNIKISKN